MEKEIYTDCQRNHACYIGGYAIDGCSEFVQCNTLKPHCIACGCHRNYHRKVILIDLEQSADDGKPFASLRETKRMARQQGVVPVPSSEEVKPNSGVNLKMRKTRFSKGQREAMREFAESLGWSMRKKGGDEGIERFCERIGVNRLVFKTWMNNHKRCYFKGTASTSTSTEANKLSS